LNREAKRIAALSDKAGTGPKLSRIYKSLQ